VEIAVEFPDLFICHAVVDSVDEMTESCIVIVDMYGLPVSRASSNRTAGLEEELAFNDRVVGTVDLNFQTTRESHNDKFEPRVHAVLCVAYWREFIRLRSSCRNSVSRSISHISHCITVAFPR